MDDDLCPEYDFTQLPVVARGQGRKRLFAQKVYCATAITSQKKINGRT